MPQTELRYTITDYQKPEKENPYKPFVDDVLVPLDESKAVQFDPFETEAEALDVLKLIQVAARTTGIIAKKRGLYMNDNGKWILEVGSIVRKERAPRGSKKGVRKMIKTFKPGDRVTCLLKREGGVCEKRHKGKVISIDKKSAVAKIQFDTIQYPQILTLESLRLVEK